MPTDTALSRPPAPNSTAVWRHILAGLCASLVSIGLARFGYTPLIPSLIQAHWFSAADVVYLGAANLAGYLLGALMGRPIGQRLSNERTLRWMMVLVTASFIACAFPLSVAWFFGWRLLSGVAGGVIMVLVAATVLPHVPAARKGLAGGAIFLGLGLGIAGSGTLVPLLLHFGLRDTWIGLGVVSAVLTAFSWSGWPASTPTAAQAAQHPHAAVAHPHFGPSVNLLYGVYALMATSIVPTMMFLVDFIARGLGAGASLGSLFWVLYGIGAIFGPPAYGFLADHLGARVALRLVLVVQTAVAACLYTAHNHAFLALLTVLIGSFPPGMVPLVLARVHQLIPSHLQREQNVAWGRATTLSAACMAASGYAFSAIFNASGGDHRLLFLIAAAMVGVALIAELSIPLLSGRKGERLGQA